MKLTTITLFLIPVVVARHNDMTVLESILKSKDNLYAKADRDVQNVMNNLFTDLNLAPTFLARSRIKLLLTMHYDLNSMAEKNYDIFDKVVDAATPDNGNETLKGLALYKLIERTLNEESLKLSVVDNKMLHEVPINENTIEQQPSTMSSETDTSENISASEPVFADSKEFMKFIKDFINKVNKLDATDFSKSTPLLPPIDEDATRPYVEVWEPTELDPFNDTRRIFTGKRSRSRIYPFVVSVHLMDKFVCAGSIVSSDLVLTAASCLQILHNNRFFRENPRTVVVRIGSDYFSRRGEVIPVLEAFFHPSYNPKNLANNLVLLRLERQIKFNRRKGTVRRIRFDRTTEHLSTNTDGIIVVGWGSRKHNNLIDQFERMMAARLNVYQIDECAQIYSRQFVTQKHFCAGYVASGGGACNKDLGGPGVVSGVLVGVVSFGAPLCGAIDAPTVFTKLGFYSKWIDSIIEQERPSILVRTTIADEQVNRYFRDPFAAPPEHPFRTTTGIIEPPLMFPENTEEEEYKNVVGRRKSSRRLFDQLFPYTPTTRYPMMLPIQLLRNILYNDYGQVTEDVNDMFKSTTKLQNANQHPLVNLSLWPITSNQGISSTKVTYNTIRLTTSSRDEYDEKLTPSPEPHRHPDYQPPLSHAPPPLTTPVKYIFDLMTQSIDNSIITTTPTPVARVVPTTHKPTDTEINKRPPVYELVYYSEEIKNKTLRIKDFLYMY